MGDGSSLQEMDHLLTDMHLSHLPLHIQHPRSAGYVTPLNDNGGKDITIIVEFFYSSYEREIRKNMFRNVNVLFKKTKCSVSIQTLYLMHHCQPKDNQCLTNVIC